MKPVKSMTFTVATAFFAGWKSRSRGTKLFFAFLMTMALAAAPGLKAQTFKNLYSFTGNIDGTHPVAGLVLSGNTLYGTAQDGGSSNNGAVFRVNTDGSSFTNLHNFAGGSDGLQPHASLVISGSRLYGTAFEGGSLGGGTVFAVNTDGTGFTNLYSFTVGNGGYYPVAGLILSGGTLYGTTEFGGSYYGGTVFKINTNGTGFTTVYNFLYSDGIYPYGNLILSGNTLYGTAYSGGDSGNGSVFAVTTDGLSFTNLHSFTAIPFSSPYTNSDGDNPFGSLVLSGSTLYGTTSYGGSAGNGTVFAVNTNGSSFTNLYSFTALDNGTYGSNSDGANPFAGLVLSGNTLYGTAGVGGSLSDGTVFKINTDGTGFTTLYNFTATSGLNSTNTDGYDSKGVLILSGNTLYGTTELGGSAGSGTVFSLSLASVSAPQLAITRSGTSVVLTWTTNAAGFTLQSATNLVSPAVWGSVSPAPVIVNGQNAVTNPVSGTKKFYRLSQ